ncbi:MAG: tetratricopeptide repeat protein [Spirochaetia bacterium]|nr:tetratricopeptide repeat protein [Spirochaetia bacterium]
MKTRSLCFLAIFLAAAPLFSADEMRIMVSRFSNAGPSNDWMAAGIEDSVINDLKKIKSLTVISSDSRAKALKELTFQLSGLVDEAKQVKVGEIVGANVVLSGAFTVVDDKIRVTARMVNVEKQDILSSAKIDGEVKKIFDVQDRIVIEILDSMSAEKKALFTPVTIGDEEKAGFVGKQNLSLPAFELYAKGLNVERTDQAAAIEYFTKAIAQDPGYVEALLKAASVSAQISQFDKADKFMADALKALQAKKADKTDKMAKYYLVHGSVRMSQYKFQDAEKSLKMAMQILEQLKLKRSPSYESCLLGLGNIYVMQNKVGEAQKKLEEAKALIAELKLDKGLDQIVVLVGLGGMNWMAKKYDTALGYYEEAERLAKAIRYEKTKYFADVLGNKGEAFYSMKDLAKALDCKQRGLAILKEIGQERTELAAYLLQGVGSLKYETGKKAEAIEAYEQCQEIRRELHLENTDYYKAVANALKVLKR